MSELAGTEVVATRPRGKLRRELRVWEAFAISIGIMAPTAAMALNGVAPAGIVGRAVPLAFLLASVAIALVSYAFIRLTSYFNHAGSAYALAGVTLGPRVGFFACWALLGTYSAFLAANFAEIGLFGASFFDGIGIWNDPDWVIISLVAAALIWVFAYNDIKFFSAVIGHYVADAHVPLHAVVNYNGQRTGQTGIHNRWEDELFMRFQKRLLAGVREGAMKGSSAGHAAHAKYIGQLPLSVDIRVSFIPVHLRFSSPSVRLWNERLAV